VSPGSATNDEFPELCSSYTRQRHERSHADACRPSGRTVVLSDVQVYWPPGNTGFPLLVRLGSLVAIDPADSAPVAAYGAGNLQDASALPGDGTTIDKGWISN
jgi:hypothetical protein